MKKKKRKSMNVRTTTLPKRLPFVALALVLHQNNSRVDFIFALNPLLCVLCLLCLLYSTLPGSPLRSWPCCPTDYLHGAMSATIVPVQCNYPSEVMPWIITKCYFTGYFSIIRCYRRDGGRCLDVERESSKDVRGGKQLS